MEKNYKLWLETPVLSDIHKIKQRNSAKLISPYRQAIIAEESFKLEDDIPLKHQSPKGEEGFRGTI